MTAPTIRATLKIALDRRATSVRLRHGAFGCGPDLFRLRLRGPSGAKDEFLLAATAQNLRKLAKLIPLPAPIFAT